MKTQFKVLVYVLCFIIGYILGVTDKETSINYDKVSKIDTIHNVIELDSIIYKITVRDSIIYHLKIQSNEAIEKSYSISDSDAVALFKQLTSEH